MARRHALLCLFLAVSPSDAATLTGRVVGVADGDTVTVLEGPATRHTIRVAGIDAPEHGQPYSTCSKENLSRLVLDQDVRVEWHAMDGSGGVVGTVWVVSPDSPCRGRRECLKTLDVGLAQLTVGLAWHYTQYAHEQGPQQRGQYEFAEVESRAKKVGLWRDRNPVPPWEWRHSER